MDYKVELDVYSGPLDLLLHLVSRDELTIERIPVARIADQFVAYLENLAHIDIEVAGDFLVMAARLTEMKSRALLPTLTTEDEEIDADLLADESDLIQRLLEYRVFKDAARWLRKRTRHHGLLFARGPTEAPEAEAEEPASLLPDGVTVYDILSAFLRISREVLLDELRTVVYDDVPIEDHIERILERIQREGVTGFAHILPPGSVKLYVVGAFLALLELIRRKRLRVEQEDDFGEIRIHRASPEEAEDAGEADEDAAGSPGAAPGTFVPPSEPGDPDVAAEPGPPPPGPASGRVDGDSPGSYDDAEAHP